eukprot:m.69760 g.69760  ORF g.69760 m.69760 type:complete len:177 (+) comp16793_c2_seq3:284-814(+)
MCVCVFAHACLPMPPAQIIYTPAEAGLIAPVSRSWGSFTKTHRPDFQYVIFDWDNIFASYIAAQHNDPAGYKFAQSNLIQVIKSSTAAGFVPNFSAGGTKSQGFPSRQTGRSHLSEPLCWQNYLKNSMTRCLSACSTPLYYVGTTGSQQTACLAHCILSVLEAGMRSRAPMARTAM